ncbi:hypothetical protein TUBRATIS_20370, partial [Tubulinosema ratisbonensis]
EKKEETYKKETKNNIEEIIKNNNLKKLLEEMRIRYTSSLMINKSPPSPESFKLICELVKFDLGLFKKAFKTLNSHYKKNNPDDPFYKEFKNNIELKKKFGTQINSIIKDNKFIVVGEESGSITFLKKDTLFDIKIQSPVHKISFLEKVDDVKYLLVTDKNGFAYILNNNKILFTIKVRDSFVYGIGNVNHIYFAGYDNRITLFNKINDEYVKVFQKDYHTSEIISFIKKGKRCLALSKDGIFSEESHGYVSKMTLFPKEVKYFNDLLIYKENNDLHFYKFDKERKKETKKNLFY